MNGLAVNLDMCVEEKNRDPNCTTEREMQVECLPVRT